MPTRVRPSTVKTRMRSDGKKEGIFVSYVSIIFQARYSLGCNKAQKARVEGGARQSKVCRIVNLLFMYELSDMMI